MFADFKKWLKNIGGAHTSVASGFVYICYFCNQIKSNMMPYAISDGQLTGNIGCFGTFYEVMRKQVIKAISTGSSEWHTGMQVEEEKKSSGGYSEGKSLCNLKETEKCAFDWVHQWVITYFAEPRVSLPSGKDLEQWRVDNNNNWVGMNEFMNECSN